MGFPTSGVTSSTSGSLSARAGPSISRSAVTSSGRDCTPSSTSDHTPIAPNDRAMQRPAGTSARASRPRTPSRARRRTPRPSGRRRAAPPRTRSAPRPAPEARRAPSAGAGPARSPPGRRTPRGRSRRPRATTKTRARRSPPTRRTRPVRGRGIRRRRSTGHREDAGLGGRRVDLCVGHRGAARWVGRRRRTVNPCARSSRGDRRSYRSSGGGRLSGIGGSRSSRVPPRAMGSPRRPHRALGGLDDRLGRESAPRGVRGLRAVTDDVSKGPPKARRGVPPRPFGPARFSDASGPGARPGAWSRPWRRSARGSG